MTTCLIVAQPLAGAVLSKAMVRLIGTAPGAAVAVVSVRLLVNAPELLTTAIAIWLSLCTYLSTLDTSPRTYIFLPAGYPAGIVASMLSLRVDLPEESLATALSAHPQDEGGCVRPSVVASPQAATTRMRAIAPAGFNLGCSNMPSVRLKATVEWAAQMRLIEPALPGSLFANRIKRATMRVVLTDDEGAILLLSTRDASNPDFGSSWDLLGGGMFPERKCDRCVSSGGAEGDGARHRPIKHSASLDAKRFLHLSR